MNDTTKHTAEHTPEFGPLPGPWEATQSGIFSGSRWVCVSAQNEEWTANSRIIAASPRLLAALQGVDVIYTELFAAVADLAPEAHDRVQAAVKESRAAIAQALGTDG